MPANILWLHLATVAAMAAFIVWLWARASRNGFRAAVVTTTVIAVWLAITAVLALSGITLKTDTLPPGGFLALGPAALSVALILLALSRPRMRGVLEAMPMTLVLLAQIFRVPVEIVLASLSDVGLLPRILSYHGTNFDILTGLTAPLAAYAAYRRFDLMVLVWNLIGIALVVNVVATSILTFSGPTNVIKVSPPADFAMTFPMVWLPAFLVPLAVLLHGIALLKLRRNART